MSNSEGGFWQQYQENLREYQRQAPWRFLRILVAFVMALILAPCCMVVANVTGEPLAAMGVALVGVLVTLVIWKLMWWAFDRPARLPPLGPQVYGQAAFGQPMMPPGVVDASIVDEVAKRPILGASTGPVPPFAAEQPRSSGGGCLVAMLAIGGMSLLLCCGGFAGLIAFAPNFQFKAGPNGRAIGPPPPPVVFGGPGGNLLPAGPPFADFERQHQQQMDEMFRQQREIMRLQEEQMRELQRQLEVPPQPVFEPGF